MLADGVVEFEGLLPREAAVGLGLGAIHLEDRVGGIKDELEAGNFFYQAKRMLSRKATPIHTVFVSGRESRIGEACDDFA